MPYINHMDIIKAKQVDLLTYLQNFEPSELVRVSTNTYSTKEHDSLKISNGKWQWFSHGIGGRSALDYLIKVRGLSFVEAVEKINGHIVIIEPQIYKTTVLKQNEFILPTPNSSNNRVISYLLSRGINREIIKYCVQNKLLYEDYKYHNVVFVGYDISGVPRYAMLRGTTEKRFIGEVLGSDKHFSFSISSNNQSEILHLFESAIDLLSYGTFEFNKGNYCLSDNYLSLAGVHVPQKDNDLVLPIALEQYFNDHPNIKIIKLHLDNDLAGKSASNALQKLLSKQFIVIDEPPEKGKDMNDCVS
jgi:hypothetical protein